MASQEDLAGDGTSSPAASSSQLPQATAQDASEDPSEDLICPICLDTMNDQASVSRCGHSFCFPCILKWSRITALCPICQRPFRHICHKVGADNYETHDIVQHSSSASHAGGGRPQPRSAERSQRHSSGRHHSTFSNIEQVPEAAPQWPQQGSARPGLHPSSSRRRQQSRAQDTACDERRAPRPERDVPASPGRSERRQRGGWASSRERRVTRSRSRLRPRSTHRQTQQEQESRRDHHKRQALSPAWDVPAYSRRRQRRQRGGQASSRERRVTRIRSRLRPRSTHRQTQREQHSTRDHHERRALSPAWDVSAHYRTRQHRQRGGRASSREWRETRSRSQHRSRSTHR